MNLINLIKSSDFEILSFIDQMRTPFLTVFFKFVTYLGDWTVVLPMALIVSAILILKKEGNKTPYSLLFLLEA